MAREICKICMGEGHWRGEDEYGVTELTCYACHGTGYVEKEKRNDKKPRRN